MMYYSDMTSHSLGEGDGMWLIVVVTCYVLVLTSCPLPGWRLVSECEWCGWRWHTSVLRLFVPFLCLHLSCPPSDPTRKKVNWFPPSRELLTFFFVLTLETLDTGHTAPHITWGGFYFSHSLLGFYDGVIENISTGDWRETRQHADCRSLWSMNR